MALEVSQIKEIIRAEKNLNPEISPILFADEGGSQAGNGNLWAYLHALASNIMSQLMDLFTAEVNTTVLTNVPATPQWIKSKILKFQSGDYLVFDSTTFVASYPTVNASKQIVTQCSVTTGLNNKVNIKVAKGGSTPQKLTDPEIEALAAYYDILNPAGISFTILSKDADRLRVEAEVFYDGQYSAVIEDNTKAAINAFLAAIPFDGTMLVSSLEAAIKAVQGVNDVMITNLWARAEETPFASTTKLIEDSTMNERKWDTVAGYMIAEDETGNTLDNTLTFTIDG